MNVAMVCITVMTMQHVVTQMEVFNVSVILALMEMELTAQVCFNFHNYYGQCT